MNWLEYLALTYDNHSNIIGKKSDDGSILLPLYHSTANADIEITVDLQGEFKGAAFVTDEDKVTVIPITEDSVSRGNGSYPHALADKLCYVAGDYAKYSDGNEQFYADYILALEEWSHFPNCNPNVLAILKYLQKGTVIADLIREGYVVLDEKGKITNKKNGKKSLLKNHTFQDSYFIRFNVKHSIVEIVHTWEDEALYQNYVDYLESKPGTQGVCYITGKTTTVGSKFPAKIRNAGDKSRLISSNDTSGYTFRGRFREAEEAFTIGRETAYKAHNALNWLVRKQGFFADTACLVAWSPGGGAIPGVLEDSYSILHNGASDEENSEETEVCVYTRKDYAVAIRKAIWGYRNTLKPDSNIVVMCVDTADGAPQGRLAIQFFAEFSISQYFENLCKWHTECAWMQVRFERDTKKPFLDYGVPSVFDLVKIAYDTNRSTNRKKMLKKGIERLLPCILYGKKIPVDFYRIYFNKAQNPLAFGTSLSWKRFLGIACSIIRKYRIDYYKEEHSMALNETCKDRSYLFGRLLAYFEKVERDTYDVKDDKKRTPNAIRMWNQYMQHPATILNRLRAKTEPYFEKNNSRIFYENEIGRLLALFGEGDFTDEKLSELFLLGYYCQNAKLYEKRESKEADPVEVPDEALL